MTRYNNLFVYSPYMPPDDRGGGGAWGIFSSYVGLDPASVYPTKLLAISGILKNI